MFSGVAGASSGTASRDAESDPMASEIAWKTDKASMSGGSPTA
jgi:hypothetical protein